MKSYREIADSVFARRDAYIVAQRKKKQAITRATVSVGSVALVSLAGVALLRNDALRDTPPVTDSGTTTTTTANPTTHGGTDLTTASTTAVTAPSASTVSTVSTTTPSKMESTVIVTDITTTTTTPITGQTQPPTTSTTTAPKRQLIGAGEPDTHSVDNASEGSLYFKRGEISPMLKESMELYKDEDVVFAVLVAVYPKFNGGEIDKAVNEFCETEEMRKLAEENNWNEYHKRVHDLKDALREIILKEELDVLYALSEIEPIKHLPDLGVGWDNWPLPPFPINALAYYSYHGHHIYSAVLSADAINELAERGTAMLWLDSPDIVNEKIPMLFDD